MILINGQDYLSFVHVRSYRLTKNYSLIYFVVVDLFRSNLSRWVLCILMQYHLQKPKAKKHYYHEIEYSYEDTDEIDPSDATNSYLSVRKDTGEETGH